MASLVLGIIGMFFTLVGLVPLLGFINYISIILLGIGLILGIVGATKKEKQGAAIGGLIICIIFLIISVWRLYIGMVALSSFVDAVNDGTVEQILNNLDSK